LGTTLIGHSERRAQETNPSEAEDSGIRGPVQHRTNKPDLIFGRLAPGDVGHQPDKLAIAGCIL
jgi:hypothetical protein